jgi:predicted MFS family arabinose efflux permease
LGWRAGRCSSAAALLPAAGVLVALRAQRPAAQPACTAQRAARAADILPPGAGLMLVNVGYVALLAFGGAATGSAAVLPVFALGVVAVRTFGATVPDRLGGHRTILVAAPLAVAGLLAIALGGAPAATLAGTVLLAAGQGLLVPALGLLALSRVPPERHGTAAGLFFAFFDAGVGAGGPLVGVVARLTTPAGALVAAAGAVTAAGLISGAPRRPGR